MTRFESVVPAESEGVRADVFLTALAALTRSRAAALIAEGRASVDGRVCEKAGLKLREGQRVSLEIPPPKPLELLPEDVPLEILYEDSDVLVLSKPSGVVVHPSAGHDEGTLVHALLAHCKDLPGIGGTERPGIVHRLDKDTSGALVVAKNDFAHHNLTEAFKVHRVKRAYLAVVRGVIKEDEGVIDRPIARDPSERKRMAIAEGGRRAVTDWRVVERFKDACLLLCSLHTGRTHQIRVHMASVGHPVMDDPVYGWAADKNSAGGQLLHAHILGFTHPRTGEWMELTAPLPEKMERVLRRLRSSAVISPHTL